MHADIAIFYHLKLNDHLLLPPIILTEMNCAELREYALDKALHMRDRFPHIKEWNYTLVDDTQITLQTVHRDGLHFLRTTVEVGDVDEMTITFDDLSPNGCVATASSTV